MRHKSAQIFAVIYWLIVFTTTLASSSITQSSAPNRARTPVVVELFTSEGWSTCPPADELLASLEEQRFVDGAEVIAIEEHVDYWNHDGWTDPFSAVEWTLRQQDYAAAFKLDGVYTPQMVIDGREQFIGSRIREVSTAIVNNSQIQKADVAITEAAAAGKQPRQFDVSVTNLPGVNEKDSSEVWLAITEGATFAGEPGRKCRKDSPSRLDRSMDAQDGSRERKRISFAVHGPSDCETKTCVEC
jgi:hypothetical protein